MLVRVGLGRPPPADELAEFEALARSAGAVPVATVTRSRRSPEPRFFIGSVASRVLAVSPCPVLTVRGG